MVRVVVQSDVFDASANEKVSNLLPEKYQNDDAAILSRRSLELRDVSMSVEKWFSSLAEWFDLRFVCFSDTACVLQVLSRVYS